MWLGSYGRTLCVFIAVFSGCSVVPPFGRAPTDQHSSWIPETDTDHVPVPEISLPESDLAKEIRELSGHARIVSLPELIQIGLRTDPSTRASWLQTQADYASIVDGRSAYYPKLKLGAQYTRTQRSPDQTNSVLNTETRQRRIIRETDKGPSLILDYLLFDFGGREAKIDEQRFQLLSSNYAHNAAVQNKILQIQAAYFRYSALRSLVKTQSAALEEAKVSVDAAEARRNAGVGTVADLLQAKTALARAQLSLQSTSGQVQAYRGSILTSVGLPTTALVDVEDVPTDLVPTRRVQSQVEELIQLAAKENPTLAASRAQVLKAQEHVGVVRSQVYPAFSLQARGDELYRSGRFDEEYSAGVVVSMPLFTGFSYSSQLSRAKYDAERTLATYQQQKQSREIAIWNDYYSYQTAFDQIETTDALYSSAKQSHDVALGRYREGVGSILDLLSAQSALEQARSSQVEARANWMLSLVQLRFDLGVLGHSSETDLESDLVPEASSVSDGETAGADVTKTQSTDPR